MRKILTVLILLVVATAVYQLVPRALPPPASPNSFSGEDVLFLQNHLSSEYFDIAMVCIYSAGYVIMIYGTGIYIFLKRDIPRLKRYLAVFVLVQAMAMLTWWRFPVAPPRMAVDGVRDVRRSIFGTSESFNPYPWGAFPSLHVANSVSAVLFMRFYGRKALLAWIFIFLSLTFSTIYLGEHYWQDVVGGIAYALAGYLVIKYLSQTKTGKKIFSAGEM